MTNTENIKVKTKSDQRRYVMVYTDFLDSDKLTTDEKMMFIALKRFSDNKSQCYPTVRTLASVARMSIRQVKYVLKSLEGKQVIKRKRRQKNNGGDTSNLYTVYDFKEMWDDSGDVNKADDAEEQRMIQALQAKGYTVTMPAAVKQVKGLATLAKPQAQKKLEKQNNHSDNDTIINDYCQGSFSYNLSTGKQSAESAQRSELSDDLKEQSAESAQQEQEQSWKWNSNGDQSKQQDNQQSVEIANSQVTHPTKSNQTHRFAPQSFFGSKAYNNKGIEQKSIVGQNRGVSEDFKFYSEKTIKKMYEYDVLIHDHPEMRQDIDAVMDVLHITLNTRRSTIRVAGQDMPRDIVIAKMMKLNKDDIMYVIRQYNSQTERVHNQLAYMTTLLYLAQTQHYLDIANQVNHDIYHNVWMC